MSLSEDLYKELIIEHAQNPTHRHDLPDANVHENGVNRSCGDEIELEMLVQDGVIKDISVKGKGCSISTASASMMADAVDGMTVEQAEGLVNDFKGMLLEDKDISFPEELDELESLRGVKRYPVRVKCATLSWNTLEAALKSTSDQSA